MSRLTTFEAAVLNEICKRETNQQATLREQIAAATVTRRENSGVGFFTYLSTDHSVAPVRNGVIGNISANIEGFEGPLLLMLFMKDGYVHMLEGATVQDSTVDIDFSTAAFNIDPT